MDNKQIELLKRALHREKEARKAAERILEDKSRVLYQTSLKLEQLLDEKSSQLQGVFENIIDAYVVIDIKGNILKFNDAAIHLLGYDINKNELNVLRLIAKEDFKYTIASFSKLQTKGFFKNFEVRIYTKSKEVKWVSINASMVYDKNQKPIAAQGIVRDITKEREKAFIINLINRVAKSILGKIDIYQIATKLTGIIAQYLGTEHCIIYIINKQDQTIEQIAAFGQKLNEKKQIIDKAIFPIEKGITGRVVRTGIAEIVADTSLDKDYIKNRKVRLSEIVVPILNEGEVIGLIDSEHDQKNYYTKSQLKTIENIASLVAMQLKSAINIRAREKAENKNKRLLKELERSNDELKEYAHIVSHDLKSPLRSIYALTSFIKEDNKEQLSEGSLQNFGLIETTLEKMELLITDILNYSSIGADTSEKIAINLDHLVKELLTIIYIPKHIKIELKNVLPIFKGDRTKLQQLFQNLIGNAIKYNDKTQGSIEIGVEDQKEYWQFYIKDNGKGIEEKYYKKIFETFEKLDNNPKSSGIGLSIVKKIVELYQGKIWLESEINIGTIFYFTLKKITNGTTESKLYK